LLELGTHTYFIYSIKHSSERVGKYFHQVFLFLLLLLIVSFLHLRALRESFRIISSPRYTVPTVLGEERVHPVHLPLRTFRNPTLDEGMNVRAREELFAGATIELKPLALIVVVEIQLVAPTSNATTPVSEVGDKGGRRAVFSTGFQNNNLISI